MKELYHHIYDGEIFKQSNCIWHENSTMDFMRSQFINLGYEAVTDSKKVWQRGDQTVIVCLVDDISTCRNPPYTFPPLPDMFPKNTIIITDNYVNCPTPYEVIKLPDSFFGIYNYEPTPSTWQPERRFNFSVNRLDSKRLTLFLELITRSTKPNSKVLNGPLEFDLERDLINFNCWHWNSSNDSPEAFQHSFKEEFYQLSKDLKILYKKAYDHMSPMMPYRNHQYNLEDSHHRAWLNVVVETYSGADTIAMSEKLFRAMVTPAPWTVYGGKFTLSWLRKMGFDILEDIVDHKYDYMDELCNGQFGDKIVDFIQLGSTIVNQMKEMDFVQLQARCKQAAEHNQKLLAHMQQQWPSDFSTWLPGVIEKIK
jgi:hypothetical protein